MTSPTVAYVGTAEAAAMFNVTPAVIRRMIASGALPATRIGARWRISAAALNQLHPTNGRP